MSELRGESGLGTTGGQVSPLGSAASPEDAARHFEALLEYETDCWDVSETLKRKSNGFVVLDVRSPALSRV